MAETVAMTNDSFRVTEIILQPGETHTPSGPRQDRLVEFLSDHERTHHHTESGHGPQHAHRKQGDIVFHKASADHVVTNTGQTVLHVRLIERMP